VDAHFLPRQLGRIALRGDLDRAIAEADAVALDGHFTGEAAMDTVEAQQVRIGLHGAEVVRGDYLDVLASALVDGAQDVAADAAEAVDADPDSHSRSPSKACAVPAAAFCH